MRHELNFVMQLKHYRKKIRDDKKTLATIYDAIGKCSDRTKWLREQHMELHKVFVPYNDWYIIVDMQEDRKWVCNVTGLNSTGKLSTSYACSIPNIASKHEAIDAGKKYIDTELTVSKKN